MTKVYFFGKVKTSKLSQLNKKEFLPGGQRIEKSVWFCNFAGVLALKIHQDLLECGTDEAGRGCLAGPVTAAAVILPEDFEHHLLKDSKQLSEKQRMELRFLIEKKAVCYHVVHIPEQKIDALNILNASILAMHRAIAGLSVKPEFIAVDGNRFKDFEEIPHQCVVQGDGKYLHIAAASILAKTYRDEWMCRLHRHYPHFNWKQNKGYPTSEHRKAIRKYGPTRYHRQSFRLLPEK